MTAQIWFWQQPDWPNFRADPAPLTAPLARAHAAAGRLDGISQALAPDELTQVADDIRAQTAAATSTLDAASPASAGSLSPVPPVLPVPPDPLIEVLEDAVAHCSGWLTAVRLLAWQKRLCHDDRSGPLKLETGRFRSHSAQVVELVTDGRKVLWYEAPPAADIPDQMRALLDWFNGNRPPQGIPAPADPLLRAGLAHLWFETIHPFADGNGRVGRALLDRALAKAIPPVARLHGLTLQLQADKAGYYAALNGAQRGHGAGDATPWLIWFLDAFAHACDRTRARIDAVLIRTRFWSTHANVSLNARQRKALSALLAKGPGRSEGGMTPRAYMAITQANNRLTAHRDLADLVAKQLLVRRGAGRATSYDLTLPGWGSVVAVPPQPATMRSKNSPATPT